MGNDSKDVHKIKGSTTSSVEREYAITQPNFESKQNQPYAASMNTNEYPGTVRTIVSDANNFDEPKEETRKDVENVARDVIKGKYGTGEARKEKIKSIGYDYEEVQEKVNELLGIKKSDPLKDKSTEELAKEVIQGKWGKDEERKRLLGDRYEEVQQRVNEIYEIKSSKEPSEEEKQKKQPAESAPTTITQKETTTKPQETTINSGLNTVDKEFDIESDEIPSKTEEHTTSAPVLETTTEKITSEPTTKSQTSKPATTKQESTTVPESTTAEKMLTISAVGEEFTIYGNTGDKTTSVGEPTTQTITSTDVTTTPTTTTKETTTKTNKTSWKIKANRLDMDDLGKPLSKMELNSNGGISKSELQDKESKKNVRVGVWTHNRDGVHRGFDYHAAEGDQIKSIGDGMVVATGDIGGGIKTVVILHEVESNGKVKYYLSMYEHVSAYDVKEGQIVKKGDNIAKAGSTGASKAHLHLELVESDVDPKEVQNAKTSNDIAKIYNGRAGTWWDTRKEGTSINTSVKYGL